MSTLLAAAAVAVAAAPSSGSAASTPPNVLFVVGDDVGYSDFGFFNDGKVNEYEYLQGREVHAA